MAKALLIAAFDFSNVAEDEFNDWYDLEHIPERQRVPGFLTLQRWIGAEDARQSVAIYDLDSLAVLDSPAYRAISGENLSPWSKRVTAKCRRLLPRFEGEQILPGDTTAPDNAAGLLLVAMTPAPQHETEFNAWYDTEHVPALARVPGVLSARRFRAAGNPKYVALYHLTSPGVVSGAEWKRASEATPLPEQIRPHITDRARLVCRAYHRRPGNGPAG
jgi:hypothetical protein